MDYANVYFVVQTPLGIKIRTTKEYWQKIIKIKHPSIAKHENEVKLALSSPDEVRQSKQDSQVYIYYKNIGNIYVCAVCDHLTNESGYIITAYLTKRIVEGEQIYVKD